MNEFYNFVSNSPWISFFLACVISSFIVNIYKVSCQFILSLILRQNCIVGIVEEPNGIVYTQEVDLTKDNNNKD
ncbi:MAG: hypothetical protein EOM41_00890 [Bacilli bacterium]|nr:hypothetical protein [Bacilli bacterium]